MSIPLNIDYQQILLHLFNFSILAGGLYLLLYRPVKQFMEQREAYYEDIHRQAQEDRDQAEQLKAAYQEKLAQADADIAQRRAEAEQELDQLRTRQTADARKEAEDILTKAREGARREREELLSKATRELMDARQPPRKKLSWERSRIPTDSSWILRKRGRP